MAHPDRRPAIGVDARFDVGKARIRSWLAIRQEQAATLSPDQLRVHNIQTMIGAANRALRTVAAEIPTIAQFPESPGTHDEQVKKTKKARTITTFPADTKLTEYPERRQSEHLTSSYVAAVTLEYGKFNATDDERASLAQYDKEKKEYEEYGSFGFGYREPGEFTVTTRDTHSLTIYVIPDAEAGSDAFTLSVAGHELPYPQDGSGEVFLAGLFDSITAAFEGNGRERTHVLPHRRYQQAGKGYELVQNPYTPDLGHGTRQDGYEPGMEGDDSDWKRTEDNIYRELDELRKLRLKERRER